MRRYEEEKVIWEEGRKYNARQLESLADDLLREDARTEVCRECGDTGRPTGSVEPMTQPVLDGAGNPLEIAFPEFVCESGHQWFAGEGSVKGIGGDSPILFEEHFQSRKRREIYTS